VDAVEKLSQRPPLATFARRVFHQNAPFVSASLLADSQGTLANAEVVTLQKPELLTLYRRFDRFRRFPGTE
jgi:hypothetical protein